MDWTNLLQELGVLGILSSLVVWLIKSLGEKWIARSGANYQIKLKQDQELFSQQLTASMEQFKAELKITTEKASHLHVKRLERIEILYSLLTDFHNHMRELTGMQNVTGLTPERIDKMNLDNVKKAGESGNQFFSYFEKNKLFFSKDTCELIERIIKELKDSHSNFSFKYIFGTFSEKFEIERIMEATNKVHDIVPPLKEELEANFREIMGVN